MVAYAHTHPNSNYFSDTDISVAQSLNIDAYVVGPNLDLQRYTTSSNIITSLGTINPNELSYEQKNELVSEFQMSWDEHVSENCGFGCGDIVWPTP